MKSPDTLARESALLPASCIVRAPAGSGKTELLTARFLTLLARARHPEEILAITFTKKAAAEMKNRIITSMKEYEAGVGSRRAGYAKGACEQNVKKGWKLIQNPSRLKVMTIDSLNGYLVNRMPWLSRFGKTPAVLEDASELYRIAAQRVFLKLEESGDHGAAIAVVLEHFNNNSQTFVELITKLLGRRDQWQRLLVNHNISNSPEVRSYLEGHLRQTIDNALHLAHAESERHFGELMPLVRYAGTNLGFELSLKPSWEFLDDWKKFAALLLTASGDVRKTVNKNQGFPSSGPGAKEAKASMLALLEALVAAPKLAAVAKLPPPSYTDEEWEVVGALINVANLAIGELEKVMFERKECDFGQIASGALTALENAEGPTDLLLALDENIRHILVDEFQDTSLLQFELLKKLVEGWERGDGRTLFLVGDPMQSIYSFREAQVGLFRHAERRGVGEVELNNVVLTNNYRSNPSLISWFNESFFKIFPKDAEDLDESAIPYVECTAAIAEGPSSPQMFFPMMPKTRDLEARQVADEVERCIARKDASVAILLRARTHARRIVKELKRRNIEFSGEKMDSLAERQVVVDIRSLAFALTDPSDRVAWLAVLRAPWCGATLEELFKLFGNNTAPVHQILTANESGLDACGRLAKVWSILKRGVAQARRMPLRDLVYGVWLELGGPALMADEQDVADAKTAFAILDGLPPAPSAKQLREAIASAYSPSGQPSGGTKVHMMTIHHSKGLEFDTVILPGLGSKPRNQSAELLSMFENASGLFLGPPPARMKGAESPINNYVKILKKAETANELSRLVYVACTRAKNRLYMWGEANPGKEGARPASGSMLEILWPVFKERFDGFEKEDAEDAEELDTFAARIRRLPARWELPALASPLDLSPPAPEPPGEEELEYLWAGEERKHIGDLAHKYFLRLHREGVWNGDRINAEAANIRKRMALMGVPSERLDPAASEVCRALLAFAEDEKGRWMMSQKPAEAELELTAMSDGPRKSIIDRTFLDENGVRWIVDFKVATHEGGDLAHFLAGQADRYRPQLDRYAAIMALREPGRTIRKALYFPLLRKFVEL